MKILFSGKDESIKAKIQSAIKEIELHRRELENLRNKLEQRKNALYEVAVSSYKKKDNAKGDVYANEWRELRKVTRVVYVSELALIQVILRLESMSDVGEIMSHLTNTFKILRKVNSTLNTIIPSIDRVSSEINQRLSETMQTMGTITPSISIDVNADTTERIVEQARKVAMERAEELKNLDVSMEKMLLETGDEDTPSVIGTLYTNEGKNEVTDASNLLNIASDELKESVLKSLSKGEREGEE